MNLIVKNNALSCIIILSAIIASGKYYENAKNIPLKNYTQKWEWSFVCQNILIMKLTN